MNLHVPIVAGVIFATGTVIDERSLLPIGSAAAVGVGIWWLGRKLQRIDDKIENIEDKIKSLPCDKNNCKPI